MKIKKFEELKLFGYSNREIKKMLEDKTKNARASMNRAKALVEEHKKANTFMVEHDLVSVRYFEELVKAYNDELKRFKEYLKTYDYKIDTKDHWLEVLGEND